jgi:HEAT repeat protein
MKPATRNPLQFALCLLVLVAVVVVAISTGSKPKVYHGKTVRQWVSLLDSHVDHQKQRDEASWAMVQIGADALPDLERILAWRSGVSETVRDYAVRFRIMTPHPVRPLELQSRACEAAYNLGERGNVDISGLVPHLRYHFTNGTYADSNSGRALAAAGPAGIAVLTNLLATGTRAVRDQAGWSLHHVKKRPEVIAALIKSATVDPDRTLRANALLYLRRCGGPENELVPLGLTFLGSEDGYDRWTGATFLRDYLAVSEVRAAFESARADDDERVRSVIEGALKQLAMESNQK